jgi:hypothetical protein
LPGLGLFFLLAGAAAAVHQPALQSAGADGRDPAGQHLGVFAGAALGGLAFGWGGAAGWIGLLGLLAAASFAASPGAAAADGRRVAGAAAGSRVNATPLGRPRHRRTGPPLDGD